MIRVYNTLTRKKEDFVALKEGEVKMYACGVTTYDEIHVGHARQAVVYDVMRAYLEYAGYKVIYVRNFTDVDDKIIKKAGALGKSAAEVGEYYVRENARDLERIKVRRADFEPRVTECIPDIIAFIEGLIQKGYAYAREGEVFFEVEKFPGYGKLSNRKPEELINTEESLSKKSPNDFVLWKPQKPGEPAWDSPWGPGRPGWHIECSAMVYKYLGERIDIHGGGIDLVFPHHENEIAQSEAFTGQPFVTYWVHNGMVMVEGTKMSKSLGNFTTVKDVLDKYLPEEIRYAILMYSFGSEMDFNKELFVNAGKRLYYIYQTLAKADALLRDVPAPAAAPAAPELADFEQRFREHMDDNFSTPMVIADVAEAFRELNRVLDDKQLKPEEKAGIIGPFVESFRRVAEVLRLFDEEPASYIRAVRERFFKQRGLEGGYIEAKLSERAAAKEGKDWAAADAIKAELSARGISVQDNPEGASWDIVI